MPLERIETQLSGAAEGDLRASLHSLVEDIGRQIDELQALRRKVLELASTSLATPTAVWQATLRTHGLLDDTSPLPADEQAAVDLIDALHPDGIQGVVEQSSSLLGDPLLPERLKPLLERFRMLPDDESAIEDLAREVAPLFPHAGNAPPVDVETMDKLLGSHFTAAQRLFLHRLRQLLEAQG